MNAHPEIRILAVDDHPGFLLGLVSMVNGAGDMKVVAQAEDAQTGLKLAQAHQPDIVLMDLRLRGMSGVEAIIQLRKEVPECRIIVITTYNADEDIYRALQAGAKAYLLKEMTLEELRTTIRKVHAGETFMPPDVASRLASRIARPSLTVRELDTVRLVVRGRSNKEISSELGITEDTVKGHLRSIFLKLGVADRTQLAIKAVQDGIVYL